MSKMHQTDKDALIAVALALLAIFVAGTVVAVMVMESVK